MVSIEIRNNYICRGIPLRHMTEIKCKEKVIFADDDVIVDNSLRLTKLL